LILPSAFKTDRLRDAPAPDPQNGGEAAEAGVSDALRRVSDLGENETVNGAQQHACT